MAHIEITQKDKLHIAEFIFALESDTLIENEMYKCIDALKNSNIIDEKEYDFTNAWMIKDEARALDRIGDYILRISSEQGRAIMSEYYAGKL